MSWEYSGDPTTSTKDEVRFLIQDIVDTDQKLSDEEIDYLLGRFGGDALAASVEACRVLSAKYASLVSKAVGDLRLELSDRTRQYADLAKTISASGSSAQPKPYAGGISIATKEALEDDDDRVRPAFEVGMDDIDRSRHPDDLRGSV